MPRLEIFQAEDDPDQLEHGEDWRWHVIADNGEIIATSGEGNGFTRRESAVQNWQLLVDFIASQLHSENVAYNDQGHRSATL